MSEINWTCPHCQLVQTVVAYKYHVGAHIINVGDNRHGNFGLSILAIGCSNKNCKEVELKIITGRNKYSNGVQFELISQISSHRLWPESTHKPQADFIPAPIVQDYVEASRIRVLSPKASATLSRRCIQGIVRDFCKISKATLNQEIIALRQAVNSNSAPAGVSVESVDAIDHIRGIGNIGAHMEKDINVIIDVEPGEAQALIEIIELLFEEWYVARHKRQEKLNRVKLIGAEKAAQKKSEAPK